MPHPIELPPKYYLSHFLELLSQIIQRYSPFLNSDHHEFLKDFQALSEDAQCLYVRMVNRKGIYFFRSSLDYKEIENLDIGIQALAEAGFIRDLRDSDKDDLLAFLPKEELLRLIALGTREFKRSWPRETLLALANLHYSPPKNVIVQDRKEELDYLLFLFFGSPQDNLNLYTLRDLGVRQGNGYKGPFKVRYKSKEEALAHFFYARGADGDFSSWPAPLNYETKVLREKCIVLLAEERRREDKLDEVRELLTMGRSPKAREKLVRFYWETGEHAACEALLNTLLEDPLSDEELLFAEDFFERKFQKKRVGVLTETLRRARTITIDEGHYRHPELGAVAWFKERNIEARVAENYLWYTLFGVLFWFELFESEEAAFQNEFSYTPFDLIGPEFYDTHREAIEEKLRLLEDKEGLAAYLDSLATPKPNPLFKFYADSLDLLRAFLTSADPKAVAFVLRAMARDFDNRGSGYPDLFVVENGEVRFIEIKAPGDSLRKNQLGQMVMLKRAGFAVEVLQVDYDANPNQTYVVVDLETTGTSATYHRITELGAVKVRNGEIIDTFQTLVNPGQNVPKRIEALTGITSEMVRSAPPFADVVDAFEEFIDGCIFVAHNVKFDYGFLQSEFERLGKRFVRPHICTSASTKKYFPGLTSYGLGNLTAHFNIPLKNHHRALCDAEAAARLLILINEKRRELLCQN